MNRRTRLLMDVLMGLALGLLLLVAARLVWFLR